MALRQSQKGGMGFIKLMPSNVIKGVGYDPTTQLMIIELPNKKFEEYPNTTMRQFQRFIQGKATCLTNDPTGRRRWWKGKSPSLGAAYNQFIRRTGVRGSRPLRVLGAKTMGFFARRRLRKINKLKYGR